MPEKAVEEAATAAPAFNLLERGNARQFAGAHFDGSPRRLQEVGFPEIPEPSKVGGPAQELDPASGGEDGAR